VLIHKSFNQVFVVLSLDYKINAAKFLDKGIYPKKS